MGIAKGPSPFAGVWGGAPRKKKGAGNFEAEDR